jgi:hypothetical protein
VLVDALPVDVAADAVAMPAVLSRKPLMSLTQKWPITGGLLASRVLQGPILLPILMELPSPPQQMAVETLAWMTKAMFW